MMISVTILDYDSIWNLERAYIQDIECYIEKEVPLKSSNVHLSE